jgi:hypothetical protein
MKIYTLNGACWIVRQVDSSTGRLAVFGDIIQRSLKISFGFFVYEKSPILVKNFLLLLYGLKCYLSLNWNGHRNADLIYFASYPNEHVVLDHIRRQIHGLNVGNISISKRNCFRVDALKAIPAFVMSAIRLQRVAKKLVRRFHFLPACRIFSTITYYARCRRLMARHDAKAVFIANHYSPECLALAAAAHQAGKKVIFANHANATGDTGYVPPLHADMAAVTSQAVLDIYTRHSHRNINAAFIPVKSPQRPMRSDIDPNAPLTVGIFLTALTNIERLQDLVCELEGAPMVAGIMVRPHPVAVVNEDLSGLCEISDRIVNSRGMTLFDNIEQCDIAICGNSTATVEILRGGVPVLYDAQLDNIPDDYNGYVKHELVLPMPSRLDKSTLERLGRFYGGFPWVSTMRYYDAAYEQDETMMFKRFNEAVHNAIH